MFRGHAISYKVEIIERKVPIVQLKESKSSIKYLFSDLLNETKCFKYQITVKFLLKKFKLNWETRFAPVYFNSVTKTVINHGFKLESSFQEILYLIDDWINKGSGWIVESIESQYINISTHRPLSRSSYISLPVELQNLRKGLINIKNKYQKYFYGVMLGVLILQKNNWKIVKKLAKHITNPEEITEEDKEFISILDSDGIEFPLHKKRF